MTHQLILAAVPPESREGEPLALTPAKALLRKMVLDTVPSPHSKRNYGKVRISIEPNLSDNCLQSL